jgi:hypothetical protein
MRSFWIDFIHHCRKVLLWVLPPLREELLKGVSWLLQAIDCIGTNYPRETDLRKMIYGCCKNVRE